MELFYARDEKVRRSLLMPVLALSDSRLTPRDVTVLAVLCANSKGGKSGASMAFVGVCLGITRQTVHASIKSLSDFGYLGILKRFDSKGHRSASRYTILDRGESTDFHRHDFGIPKSATPTNPKSVLLDTAKVGHADKPKVGLADVNNVKTISSSKKHLGHEEAIA